MLTCARLWLRGFETFIRHEPKRKAFYQLAFNPAAHKFDQALGEDGKVLDELVVAKLRSE